MEELQAIRRKVAAPLVALAYAELLVIQHPREGIGELMRFAEVSAQEFLEVTDETDETVALPWPDNDRVGLLAWSAALAKYGLLLELAESNPKMDGEQAMHQASQRFSLNLQLNGAPDDSSALVKSLMFDVHVAAGEVPSDDAEDSLLRVIGNAWDGALEGQMLTRYISTDDDDKQTATGIIEDVRVDLEERLVVFRVKHVSSEIREELDSYGARVDVQRPSAGVWFRDLRGTLWSITTPEKTAGS